MRLLLFSIVSALLALVRARELIGLWYPSRNMDLATFCSKSYYDTIIIGYDAYTGYKHLEFGEFCPVGSNGPNENGSNDPNLVCPQLGLDIKACRSNGKKVLFHPDLNHYKRDDESVEDEASRLWSYFGPFDGDNEKYRPFGDAEIDGFYVGNYGDYADYGVRYGFTRTEIERGRTDVELIKALKKVAPSMTLGISLGCEELNEFLSNRFLRETPDFIIVDFDTHKDCSSSKRFDYASWSEPAQTAARHLYVGITNGYRHYGYVDPSVIFEKMLEFTNDKSFSGFSIDENPYDSNKDFVAKIHEILHATPEVTSASSSQAPSA